MLYACFVQRCAPRTNAACAWPVNMACAWPVGLWRQASALDGVAFDWYPRRSAAPGDGLGLPAGATAAATATFWAERPVATSASADALRWKVASLSRDGLLKQRWPTEAEMAE